MTCRRTVSSAANPRSAAPVAETLATLIDRRLSRRDAARLIAAAGAAFAVSPTALVREANAASTALSTLGFRSIPQAIADGDAVADGYDARVLIRWGDKVLADAPAFDPDRQTAQAQEKQFGYNNDFIAYMPLPAGSDNSEHGLLCVNLEYTNPELMFPGITLKTTHDRTTAEQAAVELAAHGHAVVEVKKEGGAWRVVEGSRYARRIHLNTPMRLSGPAAGHARLKTAADPTGARVLGTVNNCAGGVTPWGTVLIAEENFNNYFGGDPKKTGEAVNYAALGFKAKPHYSWPRYFARFNVEKEENEANRFGWIVEFDPYDPTSTPVKRTAMGRFKHEGATTTMCPDGRVAAYCGDDEAFQFLYKFVTKDKAVPGDAAANRDLLDAGTLYVAKFHADGRVNWLPLIQGEGPLTASNGFRTQADVMIETRRAAKLLGATPMDRPEDVETNPATGRVYVILTNNTKRRPDQVDRANPRAVNRFGHILEVVPPGAETGDAAKADHAATTGTWNVLLLAGDPAVPDHGARYNALQAKEGVWMADPDNCAFDRKGRLWISTDQGSGQRKTKIADGMFACDLDGPGRALVKFFYACPRDAEMCGPCFTPDGKTLFVGVQHPGEDKDSTFDRPSTRWPDFKANMPPRPAVVAITKKDGGEIGA